MPLSPRAYEVGEVYSVTLSNQTDARGDVLSLLCNYFAMPQQLYDLAASVRRRRAST